MKESSTEVSAKWSSKRFCKVWRLISEDYLGVASEIQISCLNNMMISSIIYSCFSFLCSFCRQSARCSMRVWVTLFLIIRSLYILKSLTNACVFLQFSAGGAVRLIITMVAKNDSFLSCLWNITRGMRSFSKKFQFPRVSLMKGCAVPSTLRCL